MPTLQCKIVKYSRHVLVGGVVISIPTSYPLTGGLGKGFESQICQSGRHCG